MKIDRKFCLVKKNYNGKTNTHMEYTENIACLPSIQLGTLRERYLNRHMVNFQTFTL